MSQSDFSAALDDLRRQCRDTQGLVGLRRDRMVDVLDRINFLEAEAAELRAQRAMWDCRFTPGRVADFSGRHCPPDAPCQRCLLDRAEAAVTEAASKPADERRDT